MEPLAVIIKCQGATEVTLDELVPLHHFKTLTDEDYARGRNVFIERGFKFPFSIWIDPNGVKYTVDGHQRTPILKRMRDEGIQLPETFPANLVIADSKEDAAKDIIASETKFAEINPSEFSTFISDYAISWEEVDTWANIPGLEEVTTNKNTSDGGSKKEIECPHCHIKFIPD